MDKTSVREIEPASFDHALILKKKSNIVICLLIIVFGISSAIYKVHYEGGFLTCFREMTVNGTVFSTIVAFFLIIVNLWEIRSRREIIYNALYYMRLSSAVTEAIIFVVVLIGYCLRNYLPNDNPVFFRYDMIMMHVLVPALVILSFCINDAPVPVDRVWKRLYGAFFVTVYGVTMIVLILANVVPENKIPYSFLNVRHGNPVFLLFSYLMIYLICFGFSTLFIWLNRKVYWRSYNVNWLRKLGGNQS